MSPAPYNHFSIDEKLFFRNDLPIQFKLALNLRSPCLSLLSVGITGLCYHALLNIYNFKVGLYFILSDLHFQKLLFLPLSRQYIDLVISTCSSATFYLNLHSLRKYSLGSNPCYKVNCWFYWLVGLVGLFDFEGWDSSACANEKPLYHLSYIPTLLGFLFCFVFQKKKPTKSLVLLYS